MKRVILGLLLGYAIGWGAEPDPYRREPSWRLPLQSRCDSSPALDTNGNIYFGTFYGTFWAVSPGGDKLWTFAAGREIISAPAVGADGTIYFGSHDRRLYALAADGKKQWEFETGGAILSSPALNRDQCVYFTSVDGPL